MEAVTSGGMSALDAAFLSVQRAGHDTSVFDGLRAAGSPSASMPPGGLETLSVPLGLAGRNGHASS